MNEAIARSQVSESNLARLAREVPTSGPDWLRHLRKTALDRFEELGFPTTRDEEWRQTRVAPITETRFVRAGRDAAALATSDFESVPLAGLDCPRLVFVNGHHAPELSNTADLPAGVRLDGLAAVLASQPELLEAHLERSDVFRERAFAALNTASMEDGAVIALPAKRLVETPIHVVHLTRSDSPVVSHPRVVVLAGDGSQACIVETYVGSDGVPYFTNGVTQVLLGENAILEHVRVQWEGGGAYHVGSSHVHQARDSRYMHHDISFGARLARHDIVCRLEGEGAESTLNGLYLAAGDQHIDNHTTLDHTRAHCPSHEHYKGILAGRARAVFNGRIIVRPGAQKTDARQSNKNLLLSDDALIHTRPQLEIYADDVKCTHGATIGRLSEDALFYLRARGIGPREARTLLIQGFAGDILHRIGYDPLRERLEREAVTLMSRQLSEEAS